MHATNSPNPHGTAFDRWGYFITIAFAFIVVPFIIITAFSVLNLFIGLLVNTMQAAVEADEQAEFENLRALVRSETDVVDSRVIELLEEVRSLRSEIAELKGPPE